MHLRCLLTNLTRSNNFSCTNLTLIRRYFLQTLNQPNTNVNTQNARHIQTSAVFCKGKDRQARVSTAVVRDQGAQGENSIDLDSQQVKRQSMFPDETTPDLVFNGIRFAELPICHVKATKNNTLMTVTDRLGRIKIQHSCGKEGFKNTRKGTNVAAQATGLTIGKKTLLKGITDVRVKVRGLGPGRMTSIRGLQMAGVNIVSLTDDTPVPFSQFPRPRKQRKL